MDDIVMLERLLAAGEYATCERLAQNLLGLPDLAPEIRARGHLLLCRARIGQEQFTAAIEPGHVAAFVAREHGLFDVLGLVLRDLGYAFFYCSMYDQSAQAYGDFFKHQAEYGPELQAAAPQVRFNLGTALRAARKYDEALDCFRQAWEALRQGPDPHFANTVRSELVWEYLRSGQLGPVEDLLEARAAYLDRYPDRIDARAEHLIDTAQYRYQRGEHRSAREAALQALELAQTDELRSHAGLVLARVALAQGQVREAFATALYAKRDAEAARRDDLVGYVTACLDEMILYHEREVLAFVRENTGVETKGEE